jgi:hypothetical protein
MKTKRTNYLFTFVTLLFLLCVNYQQAIGQTIYALSNNRLYFFKAGRPDEVTLINTIRGILPGQRIVGMDFRPNTGELYALGYNAAKRQARLYVINVITARATPVGSGNIVLDLGNGNEVGVDFNPTVDRIRVVSGNGTNYRLVPTTGAVAAVDGNLRYSSSDRNAGRFPRVVAGAYTNSFIGTATTTLYNIEAGAGVLVIQNPPNDGTLNTVGSLGLSFGPNSVVDIDIPYDPRYTSLVQSNPAYLVLGNPGSGSTLYWLNLSNGATQAVGKIGLNSVIEDIAILIERQVPREVVGDLIYGVTTNNNLISFDSDRPGIIRTLVPISGVAANQVLVGTDFRPATGELYGLGYNSANGEARLYTINLQTGVATPVGSANITLALGNGPVSFDFNPTVDRIRVEGANGKNLRLNPVTGGLAATDGDLKFAATDVNAGRTPFVGSVAYTNSFIGASATTLYVYDDRLNILATQIPPNDGVLNTIGRSGITVDATDVTSDLDIAFDPTTGINTAYLSANTRGSFDSLYTINLQTGAATVIGSIGTGTPVRDIAVFISRIALSPIEGQLAFGWTLNNNLITFDTKNPGIIRSSKAITPIPAGQILVGMDFRPATGELWGMTYNRATGESALFTVDTATAVLTSKTPTPFILDLGLNSGALVFDFNPTVDRIRVMGENGRNYRLNPLTGGLAATDGNLNYASGDPNAFSTPRIGTGAYTNSFNRATTTTLYNYDINLNVFSIQNPPNEGRLNTVGASGLTINPADATADLDIFYDAATQTNTAYLIINTGTSRNDSLYTVDLATGKATLVGRIGNGIGLANLAIAIDSILPPPPPAAGRIATTSTTTTFSALPNPGRDELRLQVSDAMRNTGFTVQIADLRGQVIARQVERANGDALLNWNTSHFAPGVYLIMVTHPDGQVETLKWMKQ